jgi:hypothetical protein
MVVKKTMIKLKPVLPITDSTGESAARASKSRVKEKPAARVKKGTREQLRVKIRSGLYRGSRIKKAAQRIYTGIRKERTP